MKKVIKKLPEDTIFVVDLLRLIIKGQAIVFYRTNNNPNGTSVFLKGGSRLHFVSPVFEYEDSFRQRNGESNLEFLTRVLESRQLYYINVTNQNEIFV